MGLVNRSGESGLMPRSLANSLGEPGDNGRHLRSPVALLANGDRKKPTPLSVSSVWDSLG